MTTFKHLGKGGHAVQPIKVHASQSFSWTSGSTTLPGFSINLANDPPTNYPIGTDDLGGITNGGMYSYLLYKSIEKVFYEGSSSSQNIFGFFPSQSIFVWNIGSNYVGEQIKPQTFKIQLSGISDVIQDDGLGKLRLNQTGSDVLGNIFYENGIITVQRNITASAELISQDGISIQSGSVVTTTFMSTIDIYEHTVSCTLNPTEYNNTVNPSAFSPITGSQKYNDYINSGSVKPYITTIGLYNDQNELLVVGKVSVPIIRTEYTDQTFVVKFDE